MRSKEFMIVDALDETQQEFTELLSDHCRDTNTNINETTETEEVNNFSILVSKEPIIGKSYKVKVLRTSPIEGHRFIVVFDYANKFELLEIKGSGQLLMRDIKSGAIRVFPEIAGPIFDKTDCTLLVDDEQQFESMFALVFGDWKITRRKQ